MTCSACAIFTLSLSPLRIHFEGNAATQGIPNTTKTMKITVMKTKIAKNRAPQVPQAKFPPVSLIRFTTPPSLNSERAQKKCAAAAAAGQLLRLSNTPLFQRNKTLLNLFLSAFMRKNSRHLKPIYLIAKFDLKVRFQWFDLKLGFRWCYREFTTGILGGIFRLFRNFIGIRKLEIKKRTEERLRYETNDL